MKKFLCLLLAIVLMLSLAACKPALNNNLWATKYEVDYRTATQILEKVSFYPQELSLISEPLYTTVFLRFNKDGTFTLYQDPETEKQCVREFFHTVFNTLYRSRDYLSDTYQTDFSECSKEDFIRFYTDLYTVPDYDALIEKLVNSTYDYTVFGPLTSGTYTKEDNVITLDAEDNNYDDTATYSIENNQLTLVYVDRVEIYGKAD